AGHCALEDIVGGGDVALGIPRRFYFSAVFHRGDHWAGDFDGVPEFAGAGGDVEHDGGGECGGDQDADLDRGYPVDIVGHGVHASDDGGVLCELPADDAGVIDPHAAIPRPFRVAGGTCDADRGRSFEAGG